MKPEQWQQVREVLDQAIALAVPERSFYLDKVCANDPDLRREVESLLSSHEQAGSVFLKEPAVDLLNRSSSAPVQPTRVGRRIGVYQIVEEIGHGGMGEVYRAERADGQYDKQVAIKLVRGGFDTSFILERFRNERQILAGLDHPNIARLLDGGTTEEGIPYLVMELIEGVRIDHYCDAHNLNVTQRLQLFRQVCAAVQYAHQRLVIHRDIKPSNILVTEDGVPKLLDFGIAKILDPSVDAETTLVRPMTPEYASPEQIRGETITTATDVYSLGVVLYELLTGHSPYRVNARTSHEFARAISEVEPERPSTAILRAAPNGTMAARPEPPLTPESVSHLREGSPAKLRRRLAGDIDNIVLKAVRKEPQRRYASVEQLAEDLRRHLDGLPVTARKDSWNYRAGKFVRRHRVEVVASAAVVMMLIAGVAAIIREARIATEQRARAEKRFNDVRQLSDSLIFDVHDAIQSLPGATPARKLLLDKAVQYLDSVAKDSSDDPNLQRELALGYQRLATVQGDTSQSNLGQVGAAIESQRKAIALFEAVARANPRSVTDQLNLAMVYRMRALFHMYEPSGRTEIDQAIAMTNPLMQTNGDKVEVRNEQAQEYWILANIQDAVGDRLEAVNTFRKVRDLRQEILRTNPDYPGIRQGIAKATVLLAHQMGRFGSRDEAMQLMNTGIADYEALAKTTGGDPGVIRELGIAIARRGDVELMKGDIAAARSDFRHSRERIERLAKIDPKNTMLQSDLWADEFHDAMAIVVAGKNADALATLQRAFQGYKALHLEADVWPGPGMMQAWIGEAQAGAGNLVSALKSYEDAAAVLAPDQTVYDDARCDLAMVETKIGNTLVRMGKLHEAAAEYKKALDTANLSFSLEHMDVPAFYAAADAYAGMGDVAGAEARNARDASMRSGFFNESRTWYEKSLDTLTHIPNPSRINGNGYLATADSKAIVLRMANLTR